jgi:hypothetical protein
MGLAHMTIATVRRGRAALAALLTALLIMAGLVAAPAAMAAIAPRVIASVADDESLGNNHAYATGNEYISDDGRYVAFTSQSTNLVANDTNGSVNDLFLRDRQAQTTEIVSLNGAGNQIASVVWNLPQSFSISDNANQIAFLTSESLVAGDTNGLADVYVRDRTGSTTTLISATSANPNVAGNASSSHVSIRGNGTFVAFASSASDLVPGDTNGVSDVFLRDLDIGGTARVSVTTNIDQRQGASGRPSSIEWPAAHRAERYSGGIAG